MTLRLNGSTSGYTEIDAPAVAGSNTLVLPTGNGTADQVLATNGSGALSWADRGRMTLATAQNTTSGTSIDFTGIPSWVKRITVMFNGVSTSGTSNLLVQIGSNAAVETTSYASGSSRTAASGATAYTSATSGFLVSAGAGAEAPSGRMSLQAVGSNLWVSDHVLNTSSGACTISGAGSKTLSGTLDRLRLTTVNGTDTFDAGSVNILYEG